MHRNSGLIFERYAKPYFKDKFRVLEIGPDSTPTTYQKMVGNSTLVWETLDISGRNKPTYVANDEYRFSLENNVYDIVLSGNVIEHVKKHWLWVKELARVCKPGGHVITINPLSWPYHEEPVDCWRIYPEGMRALYEEAGLKVVRCSCESLELPESRNGHSGGLTIEALVKERKSLGYRHLYPGMGNPSGAFKTWVKKLIGWPVTTAFDTITIGVKAPETSP